MSEPTKDDFQDLKRRVEKLERQTEPIQITRLEIDSGGMHRKLDQVQEDTNTLKIQMEGARGDLLQSRESQADLRDKLREHGEDLTIIKEKQDAHSELLGQLITIGESHSQSLERIEATMATKEDVAALKATQDEMKATQDEHSKRLGKIEAAQDEHSTLLREILARLPKQAE